MRHKYYPAEAKSTLRSCDDTLLLKHYLYLLSDSSSLISGHRFCLPDLENN